MISLIHHLDNYRQQNCKKALCCEGIGGEKNNQTEIRGGVPLSSYLNTQSDLWKTLLEHPLEEIPASLKVVPGQPETIKPFWEGKWVPKYILDSFIDNPHINKYTGKLETRIYLKNVREPVDATFKKTEIISQEMWKKRIRPVQSQLIREQLQSICTKLNTNTNTPPSLPTNEQEEEEEGGQEEDEEQDQENEQEQEEEEDQEKEAEEILESKYKEIPVSSFSSSSFSSLNNTSTNTPSKKRVFTFENTPKQEQNFPAFPSSSSSIPSLMNNKTNNEIMKLPQISDQEIENLHKTFSSNVAVEEIITSIYHSPHNGAYLEILAHVCMDYLREKKLTPGVPTYYWSGQTIDHNFFKGREQHFNPMPVVYLGLEKLYETLQFSWKEDPYLDGKRVLADICQITFNLSVLQAHLGLIHGNFDTTKLRARRERQTPDHLNKKHPNYGGPFIYLEWSKDDFYKVPSYGRVWKILELDYVSLVFHGQRLISLELQDVIADMPIPYQKDLVTFARQAHSILEEQLIDEDPLKMEILNLLRGWTTCWAAAVSEIEQLNPTSNETPSTAQDLTQLEVEVCRNRNTPECKNQFFERIGRHTVCSNAIPYLQKSAFKLFKIPASAVPKNATVYRLLVPSTSSTSKLSIQITNTESGNSSIGPLSSLK